MKNIKISFLLVLSIFFIGSCQMKLPFNKSNDKLKTLATPYAIPANEEFVVGDFHESPYRALVDNKSKTTITVLVVDKNTNKQTQSFTLHPEDEATVYAAKFEKMIFQNPSGGEITINIGFNKDIQGMRYQELKEYEGTSTE